MAKINHDLRNTLVTAVLTSDALATVDNPEVKRVMPRFLRQSIKLSIFAEIR